MKWDRALTPSVRSCRSGPGTGRTRRCAVFALARDRLRAPRTTACSDPDFSPQSAPRTAPVSARVCAPECTDSPSKSPWAHRKNVSFFRVLPCSERVFSRFFRVKITARAAVRRAVFRSIWCNHRTYFDFTANLTVRPASKPHFTVDLLQVKHLSEFSRTLRRANRAPRWICCNQRSYQH